MACHCRPGLRPRLPHPCRIPKLHIPRPCQTQGRLWCTSTPLRRRSLCNGTSRTSRPPQRLMAQQVSQRRLKHSVRARTQRLRRLTRPWGPREARRQLQLAWASRQLRPTARAPLLGSLLPLPLLAMTTTMTGGTLNLTPSTSLWRRRRGLVGAGAQPPAAAASWRPAWQAEAVAAAAPARTTGRLQWQLPAGLSHS